MGLLDRIDVSSAREKRVNRNQADIGWKKEGDSAARVCPVYPRDEVRADWFGSSVILVK
jgi:hypothetical protein